LILGPLTKYNDLLPSQIDLDGALRAIARIQETYRLPPSYLTAGLRETPTDEFQMGVQDTYTIGRDAYREERYRETKIWMEEAFRQMNGTAYKDGIKMSDILDHLSWVEYKVRRFQQSLAMAF
jgi:prolyl 4-hydroxylase